MGGRGSSSGMGGGSRGGGGARVQGGPKSGDFFEVSDGRYESEKKIITAALGSAKALDPQFEIVRGEYKGQTVYRAYENHLNHREFLHRSKTVAEAVKKINK